MSAFEKFSKFNHLIFLGVKLGQIAVKANGLSKWFSNGDSEVKTYAVKDVSFEFNYGQMIFIVGPSGSGKTTLLSMISGILEPNEGQVFMSGKDLWKLNADDLADFRLHKIGFVFQDFHLFPRLTSAENVAIPLVLQKVDWDNAQKIAINYLDIVGLKDKALLPPVKLSGGEQQRVAIARAIAAQPEILILDEPTASLDGETGRKIIDFVKKEILNENRCIIIVTHDNRIFEYADVIMKMEDGRIIGFERSAL